MSGASVDLSVVIVNYRGWEKLARALESLHPLVSSGGGVEVIVVDNASGDGKLAAFANAHPGVRFVENDGNWGFADGCNRGARDAAGRWLLFLNPDAEDRERAVTTLRAEAEAHPEFAIMTARQVDAGGRAQKVFDAFPSLATLIGPVRALLRRVAPRRYPDARRLGPETIEVDWVSGSALLIRRDVFESLGGFYSGYWMYSEDVDLCRRARDAGHRIAATGKATLVHAHGGATRVDPATAALTRSEVIVSRHLYASRHLGGLHALAYHAALVITRFLPALITRPTVARRLVRYYTGIPTHGWRSTHSRP